MVQQQFIISELTNDSENSSEQESILVQKQFEKAQDELEVPKDLPQDQKNMDINENDDLPVPYSRGFGVNKVSFAIFASFKNQFVLNDSAIYKRYASASQSSFRVMGMVIPDYPVLLETLLSSEGFRENCSNLKTIILNYLKIFAENSELKVIPTHRDYWTVCKLARGYALKYLDEDFVPLKLEYGEDQEESKNTVNQPSKGGYALFERELKIKQAEIRKQVEVHAVKEALEVWVTSRYKGEFLSKYMGMDGDPDEKLEFCFSEAKENCEHHSSEDLASNNDISFTKNEESKDEINEEDLEEENKFIPEEDDKDEKRMEYLKILNNFMKEESNSHNMVLKGKIISIIDALKHNKGIVISGPRCTGKTSIIKGLGYLLKNSDINIDMRISILNPEVYNMEKLFGTAESGVMNPEISTNKDVKISSISKTVLEIATKGFELITEAEGNLSI